MYFYNIVGSCISDTRVSWFLLMHQHISTLPNLSDPNFLTMSVFLGLSVEMPCCCYSSFTKWQHFLLSFCLLFHLNSTEVVCTAAVAQTLLRVPLTLFVSPWQSFNSISTTTGSARHYSYCHWPLMLPVKKYMEWVLLTIFLSSKSSFEIV